MASRRERYLKSEAVKTMSLSGGDVACAAGTGPTEADRVDARNIAATSLALIQSISDSLKVGITNGVKGKAMRVQDAMKLLISKVG